MAIRIKARHNESVGQMLRRFKKLCEKEGLTKDIKRRQYFEKPSERARRDHRKNIGRTLRGPGGGPMTSSAGSRGGSRTSRGPGGQGASRGQGGSGGSRGPGGPRGQGGPRGPRSPRKSGR
jgi:small subunit ribosomal protein S21